MEMLQAVARAGRPRKYPRRPNAERDHQAVEPVHAIKATVMAQRIRAVGPQLAADERAGFCLGRLALAGERSPEDPLSISKAQYDAGERYAKLSSRHAALMGYSTGSPRSPILDMIAGGLSCLAEPDAEYILETRRDWSDAFRSLIDAGKDTLRGPYVATITYDICLDRRAYETLDDRLVGDLRVGLNALCRLWR